MKELESAAKKAQKFAKKITNMFTDESFCTKTDAERKKMVQGLNLKPQNVFKKAGYFDNLLIKQANASTSTNRFYMTYSVSVSANAVIGESFSFTIATDYVENFGAFIGIGPSLQSNVSAVGGFYIGFFPKTNLDGFSGWGHNFTVADGPFKIVSGAVSLAVSEDFKELQGFSVGVGAGAGVLPVDVTYQASHDWKL
ncbi:MAG: hypothetical protein VW268_02955 [Rhodospirillaceae bacterium]